MDRDGSQTQAPFFEEILRYARDPLKPFHTPGHKRGVGWEQEWLRPERLAQLDLSEISALNWADSLEKAERLAAEFYQADRSFFLVQGASQGILGIILGAFQPGDKVLIGRNCHRSVMHAVILADLIPVYLELNFSKHWGIPLGIRPDAWQQKLIEHPDCKGIIITNPTYQGVAQAVSFFREFSGERLLIIDEAHGGYFSWSGLPGFDACQVADAWIQGTHKMLGSLTQTGMLHLRLPRIDPDKIKRSLEYITTTSPSYILLASLDSNRRFLATSGKKLFQEQAETAADFKRQLMQIDPSAFLTNELLPDEHLAVDPWKLCFSFKHRGLNGYEVEKILRTEFGIQAEYADLNQVTCFMAPWQHPGERKALQKAVVAISGRKGTSEVKTTFSSGIPPLLKRPHQAALGPGRYVDLEQAVGQIAAAIVSPYPPGIPLIGPGELIRKQEVQLIAKIRKFGGEVRGLTPQGEIRITNCG